MINETINATVCECSNCSVIHDTTILVAKTITQGAIDLAKTHNAIFVVFAIIGLISVLASVVNTTFKGMNKVFYILALPILLILFLVNKKKRTERVEELKSFWKKISKKKKPQQS